MGAQPHKDIQYLVPSEYGSEYLESQFLTRQMWDIDDACKLITIGYPYNFEFLHDQQDRKREKFEESERKFDSIQDWRELSDDNLQSQWEELERSQHKLVMMEIVYDRCKRKSMESVKHGEIKERDTKENWLKWAKLNGYKIGHLELATTDTAGTEEAPTTPPAPEPTGTGGEPTALPATQGMAESPATPEQPVITPTVRSVNTAPALKAIKLQKESRKAAVLAAMNYLLTFDEKWKTDGIPYNKPAVSDAIKKGFNSIGLAEANSIALRDDKTKGGIVTDLEILAKEGHFFFKDGRRTELKPLLQVISQRNTPGSPTK